MRTRIFWTAGWFAAAVSAAAGVLNASRHSQDFQWSPTHLILQHVNPWQVALAGDPHHQLILSQGPNYAHFLYLLFAPFGAMSFPVARLAWAFCNMALAGVALWYCQRIFDLRRAEWAAATILFLLSTSFRNAVGNGQQSILVLACIALAYGAGRRSPHWLWFGLSYCKYSFSPPYFFDLLFSRQILFVVATFLPAVVGLVWVHWMVGGSWMALLLEPLRVGTGVHPSFTDWMAVVDTWIAPHLANHAIVTALLYGVPMAAACVLAWFLRFRVRASDTAQTKAVTAAYGIASLLLFRHLGYDFVFLLFPLFYAIEHRRQFAARWILAGTLYFWFVIKLIDLLPIHVESYLLPLHFPLLLTMLVAVLRIRPTEQKQSA